DSRQNLEIRHWEFNRERAPAVESGTRSPSEKIGVKPDAALTNYFCARRDSTVSQRTWRRSLCASWILAVESLATKRSASAMPIVNPPSLPRNAMVFSLRDFASSSARCTFYDLLEVVFHMS